ncbi:MAG: hypothetical protein O3A82_14325 [Verrucomicrobia bacterium]|nr:hypothetical protein [Verrucomicrobiota bacterium]
MTAQGDTPENLSRTHLARHFPLCHCEERSDAAIQRSFGQPLCFCVVIARSAATRQSSGRVREPPHRPGLPHDASDWIATSVLFETFLAMT